jgi:hypothetical protein
MKIRIRLLFAAIPVVLFLTGCGGVTVSPVVKPAETMVFVPSAASTPTTQPPTVEPRRPMRISDVVTIDDLSAITGYTDYQYLEPEYNHPENGEPAGNFWSVYTATVEIRFRAHARGGMEKLEDYRTAANPGSLVWVESPLWDSGCYYMIGEYDADFVVTRGDECFYIGFIPSAYPQFDPVELGRSLMTMFIQNSDTYNGRKK